MGKQVVSALVCASLLAGCASNPDKIGAAYVSPLKYKDYDCDQIAIEMDSVGHRTTQLYYSLRKKRKGDNWQMGVGLVLFWPALFALEGGDGPEAAEYAQLKGEYEALRDVSVQKKCGIEAPSPEEIIKRETEKDKKQAKEAKRTAQRKGGSEQPAPESEPSDASSSEEVEPNSTAESE